MNFIKTFKTRLTYLTYSMSATSHYLGGRNFSSLSRAFLKSCNSFSNSVHVQSWPKSNLNLLPVNSFAVPICGFKVKGHIKPRCIHCYYACIDGVLQILCDKYPRHKQKARTKSLKRTWILTHASQSKYRPY